MTNKTINGCNYIVERVPSKYIDASGRANANEIWYCHMKDFPNIPVLGSIGDKKKAIEVCKTMNLDGKVRYM